MVTGACFLDANKFHHKGICCTANCNYQQFACVQSGLKHFDIQKLNEFTISSSVVIKCSYAIWTVGFGIGIFLSFVSYLSEQISYFLKSFSSYSYLISTWSYYF